MNYFKILVFIQKGDKDRFGIPVEVQKRFLSKLGNPQGDIDRSIKQYKCQNLFSQKWKIIILNFFSVVLAPALVIILLVKGFFVRSECHIDAIASLPANTDFFPKELLEEFNVDDAQWDRHRSLQVSDIRFITTLFSNAVLHPYFVMKSIYVLASYSDMIKRHSPKALLSHCEYSFTSSLLTAFCQSKKVLHVNTMHGDKFFHIRDAYVHFDRFYVWDEHYKNLFIAMMAESSQFRTFEPGVLKFDCKEYENNNLYADYKYYLQMNTEDELKSILQSLRYIEETTGASYKLRPHPRYSDVALLRKLAGEAHIEDYRNVSIQESVSNCKYVVGSFSTVLSQAYYSGRTVVLDDVTYKEQYEKLKEMNYILTSKETVKLSELL